MSKKNEKDELKDIIPVFHLKPKTTSRVENILTLYIKKDSQLHDDQLEIETTPEMKEKIGENTLLLGTVNSYVMIGKYCACNIPGSYLLENNRIPIYYLSIIYNRQFITGCLFNIFLYFDIDEDTKKRLDTPQKYYKALMNGKFVVKFVPLDDDFLGKIRPFIEREYMIKYNDALEKCVSEEEKTKMMEKIIDVIDNEMNEFTKILKEKSFEHKVPTQKEVYKVLNSYCDLPAFKKMVNYGLLMREKERLEDRYPDGTEDIYKIPENIIKLSDIKKDPSKLSQIMVKRCHDSDDELV
jgi:hypothetical protein